MKTPNAILAIAMAYFFIGKIFAQNISINAIGALPDNSAMLDISSATKGLLIPRVSLADITDTITIPSPANAVVAYNTNAAMTNGNGVGFYYYCRNGCATVGWKFMAMADNGPGANGQVLASQGSGSPPQWSTLSSGGGGGTGCANCITSISNYEGSAINWINCADACRNLVEGGFSDWRMPTSAEAIYYRTVDIFNPPDGSWIAGPVWTGTHNTNTGAGAWFTLNENNGALDYYGFSNLHNCRCVR